MANQKYIVDGTTIKHGGKHFADGSVIELPEDLAANLRVRLPGPQDEKPKQKQAEGSEK